MQDPDFLRFGAFTLDRRRRELSNAAGRITLHARAFDMLVYLIDSRDRVVPREQILAHVWSGLAVGDNNLNVQMSTLRRLLASNGGADLIITVPGQGYRFVGEVIEEPCELAAARPAANVPLNLSIVPPARASLRLRPPWSHAAVAAGIVLMLVLVLALRAVLAPPPPPLLSIAVLPFHDTSAAAGHGYMAEEITDDLTVDLAYIPGSTVIAREGVALRAPKGDSRRIGRDLNVRYLVEGSIGFVSAGYSVDARLVEAATGQEKWTDRFDVAAADIADVRTMVVRRISSILDVKLTEIVAPVDRPDDADVEDKFYRARSLTWKDDTLDGLTKAQHMLEDVVRRKPAFTQALAQLGLTLVLKLGSARDPDDEADTQNAERVIALALQQQDSAVAFAARARLMQSEGDCEAATQNARASLMLEPNSLDGWAVLARCAATAGRLDEAASDIATALRLNPVPERNKPRYALLSQVELLRGNYQAAIDAANQAVLGDPPPRAGGASMGREEYVSLLKMSATALLGATDRARALYAKYRVIWPNRSVWRVGAFSSRTLADLPGFARFLHGLTLAGMAYYATELPAPDASTPTSSDFEATPANIVSCIFDAAGTAAAVQAGAEVLDVGEGVAVIKNAHLIRSPGDAVDARIDGAVGTIGTDHNRPIVVVGSGVYGIAPVRAVHHLLALGYRHVCWFRGGEEAWAAAHLDATP